MPWLKILVWIICGIVGTAALMVHFYLDFRLWWGNIRREPPPVEIGSYLGKATISIMIACSAAYVAFLAYSWEAIRFFWLYITLTALALGVTVVPMIYSYYFSTARAPHNSKKASANGTETKVDENGNCAEG